MGDLYPAAFAAEPPDVRPYAAIRRHRPLTGTAGLLLFVCMFLPALKGCGEQALMPLELPPFLPPYLYGLVFAFAAQARSQRGVIASVIAMRMLATVTACAGFVVFLIAPAVGIVELSVGVALIVAIGGRGYREERIALTAVVMGAVCVLWFGLWTLTADALVGVHLALASSVALFLGGAWWWIEVLQRPPCHRTTSGPLRGAEVATVPLAIAVSSGYEGIAVGAVRAVRRV